MPTVLDALLWVGVAVMGWIAISIAIGVITPYPTALLQALSLYVLAPAYVVLGLALLHRRWLLAGTTALLVVAHLVLLLPLVMTHHDAHPVAGAPRLHALFANVRLDNKAFEDIAAAVDAEAQATNADVIALAEVTKPLIRALQAQGLLARYPNQVIDPGYSRGIGLFSRLPLVNPTLERDSLGLRPGIRAGVRLDDGHVVNLFVIHPYTPTNTLFRSHWAPDLELIRRTTAAAVGPTLVIGDFNATYFHPPFRDFLADGFTDVHKWLGEGMSRSWRMDGLLPPLVRLDHALVRAGAHPLDVADFVVPGSDHKGFVAGIWVDP